MGATEPTIQNHVSETMMHLYVTQEEKDRATKTRIDVSFGADVKQRLMRHSAFNERLSNSNFTRGGL